MKKVFILLFIVGFFILSSSSVFASDAQLTKTPKDSSQTSAISLQNPLGSGTDSFQILIGKVITAVMGVVGSIALLMFIYGGITWMSSSGNQEKVKKGQGIIVWAAIGLVVIFLSYALTRFVLSSIAG